MRICRFSLLSGSRSGILPDPAFFRTYFLYGSKINGKERVADYLTTEGSAEGFI